MCLSNMEKHVATFVLKYCYHKKSLWYASLCGMKETDHLKRWFRVCFWVIVCVLGCFRVSL